MGTSMVALPYPLRAQLGRDRRLRRRRAAGDRAVVPVLLALRPRGHLHRRDHAGDARRHVPLLRRARGAGTRRRSARCWRSSFATKESTFITIFVAGTFFLVAIAVQARGRGGCARRRSCARCSASAGSRTRGASPRSSAVYTLAVHDVPHAPERHLRALDRARLLARPARRRPRRRVAGLLRRSCCSRTSGRCCCSAPSGAVAAFRRPTLLRLFLVWAFVLSLIVYSWAGEKFAWLVLHPLLPLILLAGVGLQAIWAARHALARARPALGVDGAGARLHGLRLRARQRRPPRRPARVPRLHAVLDRRRRPGARDRRAGQAPRRQAEDHDRLGRGRDLPVGLVLPRPRRRLPRPVHRRRAARRQRRDRAHPGLQHAPAADPDRLRRRARSASASGGCATTARCRPATGGAGSPRASRGTRPAGCRSGSTCGGRSPPAASGAANVELRWVRRGACGESAPGRAATWSAMRDNSPLDVRSGRPRRLPHLPTQRR